MKALAMKALLGAGVVAGCLGATYAAATLALQRPDAWRIDAALASVLEADYSSDDYSAQTRQPLNPEIVESARTDEAAVSGTPQAGVAPAAPIERPATPVPAAPAATEVAPLPTNTPMPRATNTATPEPEPTETEEPTVTKTPRPSPTVTPQPGGCPTQAAGAPGCQTPSATSTTAPPPTATFTPTKTATPRSIIGCLIPKLPLIGDGDKCNTHTPTPQPDTP